MKVNKLRVEWG